jgi:hypothetical protein
MGMASGVGAVSRPFRLEATALALPVEVSSDPGVAAPVGQLRGDAQATQQKQRREDRRHH